mgnify:CR=1 FL=1
MEWIDLRSDTVTRPSGEMLEAMMNAPTGDDVYGEDPTVNRLETLAASILGTEAALFCSSGTQSNLLALLSHCARGDEYIAGQSAHTYRYEAGGAAVLGSIQPQPMDFEPDGTLDLEKAAGLIKPQDYHFARTRLFCLENTQAGKVLPPDYLARTRKFAGRYNLGLHLDGARVFNAAVKLNLDVREITKHVDTVSCCLSKGLGAPVGSVLCGPENLIREARKWRKMVGGGMRQAGILAAAGEFALTRNVDRLALDHENAARLAKGLSGIPGIRVPIQWVQTNILFAQFDADMEKLMAHMKDRGILIDSGCPLRLVTHLDIDQTGVDRAVEGFREFFKS